MELCFSFTDVNTLLSSLLFLTCSSYYSGWRRDNTSAFCNHQWASPTQEARAVSPGQVGLDHKTDYNMALTLHLKYAENLKGRAERLAKVSFRGEYFYGYVETTASVPDYFPLNLDINMDIIVILHGASTNHSLKGCEEWNVKSIEYESKSGFECKRI